MLTTTGWRRRTVGAALLSTLLVTDAFAQTTTQFPIQFDFLNPGARSLALGSAFIGLGDDATAALTNPAGLMHLVRPEVSVEGRFRRLDTRFLARGRLSGVVQNRGEDTIAGPVYDEDVDQRLGPSFLSFTYPTATWAIAAYRHELSDIDSRFLYRGAFERATVFGTTIDEFRDLPLTGTRHIAIRSYGASVAARLRDRITFGAGVAWHRLDMTASFARLAFENNDIFGAVDMTRQGSTASQDAQDSNLSFNTGVQVQVAPALRLGAVYRRGPAFDFTQVDNIPGRPTLVREGRFKVPDMIGVGLAWRPAGHATVAVDYVRVNHSAIKEDFINLQAISTGREDLLAVSDSNEWHLGVEWVFTNAPMTPAVRGGVWFEPDHSVRFVPTGAGDQLDTRFQFILPGGEDLWHYTAGVGLPLSGRFELNAAADVTSRSAYISTSVILRF